MGRLVQDATLTVKVYLHTGHDYMDLCLGKLECTEACFLLYLMMGTEFRISNRVTRVDKERHPMEDEETVTRSPRY